MGNWIPVGRELPINVHDVHIAYAEYPGTDVAWYNDVAKKWYRRAGTAYSGNLGYTEVTATVSHWQPFPEHPTMLLTNNA